jgi:diacylglycerol kinase (ATP)
MSKQQSAKPNGTGLARILKATYCSYKGFKAAWIHESAFRQELLLVIILLPLSFVLSESRVHLVVLIASLLFLLFAEIINSAIEALADSVSLEHNVLIGRAKDMGSSGVFLAISLLVLVWGEALYSRFFAIAIS